MDKNKLLSIFNEDREINDASQLMEWLSDTNGNVGRVVGYNFDGTELMVGGSKNPVLLEEIKGVWKHSNDKKNWVIIK